MIRKQNLVVMFRTDASRQIGSGHVMRCLTLAEALQDAGGTTAFITRNHPGNLNDYIKSKGFNVHSLPDRNESNLQQGLSGYEKWLGVKQDQDAKDTIQALSGIHPDWLIVDHYALDNNWEEELRPYTKNIMVIDDLANRCHDCDVLLDQNFFHDQDRYNQLLSPATIKLLGPQYALLHNDFAKIRKSFMHNSNEINRVFIFLGGTDPDNLTTMALKAMTHPNLQNMSLDVVIGLANPHQEKVREQVQENPNAKLHIQVENIAELMVKADIAFGAGGTTTWERMAVGLPSIVVTIAENQIAFIKDLDQAGYLNWFGNTDQVNVQSIQRALLDAIQNPHLLLEQSKKSQELVDGLGNQLIAKLLTLGPEIETLTIRRADSSDCLLYWHWVNDPVVRESAINQEHIKWEDHQSWFDQQLNNADTILLLIECNFGPIGQVLFNRSGSHYTISYSISRQFRSLGLSKAVLSKAIDFFRQHQLFILISYVKETNVASRKVFEQLGFHETLPPLGGGEAFSITILSDRTTWMNPWISTILADWAMAGHRINWVHEPSKVSEGDFCFMLSCGEIVSSDILNRNKNNLVVHGSALPQGKGWSPLSWQIIEGAESILITLFEATDNVDSGMIYLQEKMQFQGHELIDELRQQQAEATMRLCKQFVAQYPSILDQSRKQNGESTFYSKRTPSDSQLDPNKTIAEQFNLLRIVDNKSYPAYFDLNGTRYILKVEKET
jgi:UDP-2,4-diacetamido-2,4,6-trideoxy-beta-L-altropyranose hydrolase